MRYFLGVDIGGSKCAVNLAFIENGINLCDKIYFQTNANLGFLHTYNEILDSIREILSHNKLTNKDVRAIGISCGGPLDSNKGVILSPPNLPGWDNIPITQMLEEEFDIPAYLLNDANACALVEWQMGAGCGTNNMIFLTMGTGMGAGIIANGQLICGMNDMAGEVGHIRLTNDGPVGFGKAGSFEGYSSGGGIALQVQSFKNQLLDEGLKPDWVRDNQSLDSKILAEYARKGDPDAVVFFDKIGEMLGHGIALLIDTLNPECIVIGSIFVRCEDILRPAMERTIHAEALPYSMEGFRVIPAKTGESIGDFASIIVALHAMGIDHIDGGNEMNAGVIAHFENLFCRYPILFNARDSILEAYKLLRDVYRNQNKLLLCGNGGSCADCDHIVGELMKGFLLRRTLDDLDIILDKTKDILNNAADYLQQGLPAISLCTHTALSTAYQNDALPVLCFAQQVIGYGKKGDALLCISTSGNAQNVVLAAVIAKARGLITIGLTGAEASELSKVCDITIQVPGEKPAEIQEHHLPVYHTLCAMLEEKFFGKTTPK